MGFCCLGLPRRDGVMHIHLASLSKNAKVVITFVYKKLKPVLYFLNRLIKSPSKIPHPYIIIEFIKVPTLKLT